MNTVIKSILIVDDEEALVFGFTEVLKSKDMKIDSAHNLLEAKSLIRKNNYDVVITDLRLTNSTEMEGIEIIRLIKDLIPTCKIIILTAYGAKEIREKVLSMGADCYFEKPVSPRSIKKIINTIG